MDADERVYAHDGSVVYLLFSLCGLLSFFLFGYAFGKHIDILDAIMVPFAVGVCRSTLLLSLCENVKVTTSSSMVTVKTESRERCVSISEIQSVRTNGDLFLHNGGIIELEIGLHPFCRAFVRDMRSRINRETG